MRSENRGSKYYIPWPSKVINIKDSGSNIVIYLNLIEMMFHVTEAVPRVQKQQQLQCAPTAQVPNQSQTAMSSASADHVPPRLTGNNMAPGLHSPGSTPGRINRQFIMFPSGRFAMPDGRPSRQFGLQKSSRRQNRVRFSVFFFFLLYY